MFYDPVIRVNNLNKCYQLYAQPHDRLKQFLWRGRRQFFREFWALRNISFEIMPGEVIGIVGRNGSGKSTLLQLICGTLTPSHGEITVTGRVAALLELGAGFNPEFSGRENVWMSASILGLTKQQIATKFEDIVDFSGIRDFIDQPVKTYSSGMYVRLAFAVATSVDPDILVIDEALSVGDGAFARKSFNRIMELRDAGKTILFCSHSLFQVESICNRAFWINNGQIMEQGDVTRVVTSYQAFLDANGAPPQSENNPQHSANTAETTTPGQARLNSVSVEIDGQTAHDAVFHSGRSTLSITTRFTADPQLAGPTLAVTLQSPDGRVISSVATWEDEITLRQNADGAGQVTVSFNNAPLLRGKYLLSVYLLCERGVHLYDSAIDAVELDVQQEGRLQGYFAIPHQWTCQ